MDLPIQRLPPMVGPQPPARIPRLGDRERNPKDRGAEEDQESAEERGGAPPGGEPQESDEDQENPDPPPDPGAAGSTLDLTA
jgi:hypothetical protein